MICSFSILLASTNPLCQSMIGHQHEADWEECVVQLLVPHKYGTLIRHKKEHGQVYKEESNPCSKIWKAK